MGVLHVAISHAPGWRIARLFAAIAFTAAVYNIFSLLLCLNGLSDAVYMASANLSYLIATLHGVCWILYAYADQEGSMRSVPRPILWLAVSVVALCVVLSGTGSLLYPQVSLVTVHLANISYHYQGTTPIGDVYALLATGLAGIAFVRLARRYRGGERTLGWQIGFYVIFVLCG